MARTTKKMKHVPIRKLFWWWKTRLLIIIFAVVYFWPFVFIPDPIIQWVASRIGAAIGAAKAISDGDFPVIVSALATFGIFIMGDPLLRGKSKASKYFKGEFPSVKIARDFRVRKGDKFNFAGRPFCFRGWVSIRGRANGIEGPQP